MRITTCIGLVLQFACISFVVAQDEPTEAERIFSASMIANTSASSSGDDILIAEMFAQQFQPDNAPNFLTIELDTPEHNRLRYSLAAYYCLAGGADQLCSDLAFDSQLIALDPDNLEPYLYSMLKLVETGNREEALLALTTGNAAPGVNNYYFEKLNLLRSRLASAGYPEEKLNGAAEGLAGARPMYALYTQVLSVCTASSRESVAWKAQCLTLGRRLENEGKTAMQNIFGLAIQRDSLGNSPSEAEERIAVLARRDTFNAIRDEGAEKLEWWLDTRLKTDELYQKMTELGEIQTVQQELTEIE